jgi:hypothetical protein
MTRDYIISRKFDEAKFHFNFKNNASILIINAAQFQQVSPET